MLGPLSHIFFSFPLPRLYEKQKHTLRSRTPSTHGDTSQRVRQIRASEPAPGSVIRVQAPGPPFTCGAAGSQSPATGGPGSDCSPLHSSVTAVTCSVESCTKGRETAWGPGGPQLPLQLGLCKKPLWDSVFRSCSSLASHMPPASFQVWRNSGEVMPHL